MLHDYDDNGSLIIYCLDLSASNVSFEDAEAFSNELRYCNTIAIEIISGLNPLQSINDRR